MMRLLYTGSTSACIERINALPYYAPEPFTVTVNGAAYGRFDSNVFSVFGLQPDTDYSVAIDAAGVHESIAFRTAPESCAIDVRSFGAAGDGVTDDTAAIRTAIQFLPDGGRLIFPKGVYCTRPLALKSHITIELQKDAVLLGSADRSRYPVLPGFVPDQNGTELPYGTFEGVVRPMYASLLTAIHAEDIAIVGEGALDGNAQNSDFWTNFENFEPARPRLVYFCECKNVTMHGFTAKNSPSWNFHPFHCENVSFYQLFIQAPKDSPNTDAIDPEACDGVQIIGCRFSVGDDCIAIKSGKIDLAKRYQWPADHHTVRNCLMEFGHGAVTLGSETAMGIRNLTVEQCRFHATDRGLRIKTRRGRGRDCNITGVAFENIRMDAVKTPVVINMWYNCCDPDRFSEYVWSRESLPVDDRTPHLGTFRFSDMVCTDAQAAACYIDGLPEMPIDEVTFERVRIAFSPDAAPAIPAMQNFAEERCRLGLYFDNVRSVKIRDVQITGADGDAVITRNCAQTEVVGLIKEP